MLKGVSKLWRLNCSAHMHSLYKEYNHRSGCSCRMCRQICTCNVHRFSHETPQTWINDSKINLPKLGCFLTLPFLSPHESHTRLESDQVDEENVPAVIKNSHKINPPNTVNQEIFAIIIFSRIALKDIFVTLKIRTRAWFTYISKQKSYLGISQGFYFQETSHMRSFAKIKPSQKFPNLQ